MTDKITCPCCGSDKVEDSGYGAYRCFENDIICCDWLQSRRVEPAPKAVPELPDGVKIIAKRAMAAIREDQNDDSTSFLILFMMFGWIERHADLLAELRGGNFVDWLALCDGCTAEDVVAKLKEAGR
jgi:hypothetical protein